MTSFWSPCYDHTRLLTQPPPPPRMPRTSTTRILKNKTKYGKQTLQSVLNSRFSTNFLKILLNLTAGCSAPFLNTLGMNHISNYSFP